MHKLRQEAQLPSVADHVIRHNVSNGALGMVQAALELTPEDPLIEYWRDRFLTLYTEGLGQHSTPYPGMPELVHTLGHQELRGGWLRIKWSASPHR